MTLELKDLIIVSIFFGFPLLTILFNNFFVRIIGFVWSIFILLLMIVATDEFSEIKKKLEAKNNE